MCAAPATVKQFLCITKERFLLETTFFHLLTLLFHSSLLHSVSKRSTVDKQGISVLHTFNYTLLISLAVMCPSTRRALSIRLVFVLY